MLKSALSLVFVIHVASAFSPVLDPMNSFLRLAMRIPVPRMTHETRRATSPFGLKAAKAGTEALLLLEICTGDSCGGDCYDVLKPALKKRFGDKVVVKTSECLSACQQCTNVKVSLADGSDVTMEGMSPQEMKRSCFTKVDDLKADERVLNIVGKWIEATEGINS